MVFKSFTNDCPDFATVLDAFLKLFCGQVHQRGRGDQVSSHGEEPFVLLSDSSTFGSLAGGKEIDVLVNH